MASPTARQLALELHSLPEPRRRERILQLIQADPALAAEVERLLQSFDTDTAAPVGRQTPEPHGTEQQLGPYRLLERLGHGGMGTVWLAEQAQPRRLVALKTIRPELLSDKLRERFAHEARFLAALNHPAIARIHESGSSRTPSGETPWLAMEYVQGSELLVYAQARQLDLAARLRLLIGVAEGVQHAHVRGVIHRDLKPANILIETETGAPKILDFGIARAIDDSGPAATRLTRAGEVVGTLQYMSPEQLGGNPTSIDLRCDVYALGVILYELLCGRLPHELDQLSLIEAIQRITETPPRHLAAQNPKYAGDLDTIVMKALASEPAQRYQSAAALAEDLQNFLEHRPIRARPPSRIYLVGKFVRRHRALVAAAAIAVVALLAATAWSLVAAGRADAARVEAEARAQELQAINSFVANMLTGADPELGGSVDLPLKEVLEGAERTLHQFAAKPRTAGQVALLLGRTWGGLGATERAQPLLEQALQLLRAGFGDDAIETSEARMALAEELGRAGQLEPAAEALRSLVDELKNGTDRDPALTAAAISAYAQVIQAKGESTQAIALLRQAETDYADLLTRTDPDALDGIRYNLAYALLFSGDFKEAEIRLRAVVEDETRRLGANHPQTLYSIKGLGQSLHRQGRLDEALTYYQQVYEQRKAIYGTNHPATINAATQVAAALNSLKQPAAAEPILREVIAAREQRGEQNHPQMVAALNVLATTLTLLDRPEEAMPLVDRAIATEQGGKPNQETVASRNIRAGLLTRAGNLEECAREFSSLIQLMPEIIGKEHVNYAVFLSNASTCDLARGDLEQARRRLEEALPLLEARFGPEHARTLEAKARLQQTIAGGK